MLQKAQRTARTGDKDAKARVEVLTACEARLAAGNPVRGIALEGPQAAKILSELSTDDRQARALRGQRRRVGPRRQGTAGGKSPRAGRRRGRAGRRRLCPARSRGRRARRSGPRRDARQRRPRRARAGGARPRRVSHCSVCKVISRPDRRKSAPGRSRSARPARRRPA